MSNQFLILPILIPLISGICIALLPFRSEKSRNLFNLTAVLLNSFVILWLILSRPSDSLTLLTLTKALPFALKLDGLGIIFLGLIGFLWPVSTLYSFEYTKECNYCIIWYFYIQLLMHFHTIFHSSCTIYTSSNSVKDSNFSISLPTFISLILCFYLFLIVAVLIGRNWPMVGY